MTERSDDRIETPQLTLVRATTALLMAEEALDDALLRFEDAAETSPSAGLFHSKLHEDVLASRERFRELLDAYIPDTWARLTEDCIPEPRQPPLDDYEGRDLTMLYLRSNPESRWGMWYLLLKRPLEKAWVIGVAGFKAPPSNNGAVEIGYWIERRCEAVDLAAEAVGALIAHAFEDPRVQRVIAQTSTNNIRAIRVLGKNGFVRAGAGGDHGSLRLQRDRGASS